ncbi:MAG: hypothetical protein Q9167_002405 [Letrouitia subvulpina]
MTGSALLGQPPATQNDYWVIRGSFRIGKIPYTDETIKAGFKWIKIPSNPPHDNRTAHIYGAMAVVIVLVTLITWTRIFLRYWKKELRFGSDDWAIILAWIGVMVYLCITIGLAKVAGAGYHLYDITYENWDNYNKLNTYKAVVFYVTVGLIKVSITLFNRRLTSLTSRKWQIAHYTFLIILVGYIIAIIFAATFICSPYTAPGVSTSGKPEKAPKCRNFQTFLYRLQHVSASRKLRIGFLFSFGAVSCIGAVMRQVVQGTRRHDQTYEFPDYLGWAITDIFFAITAASLPVLNALIPARWSGSSGKRSGEGGQVRYNLTPLAGGRKKQLRSLGSEGMSAQSKAALQTAKVEEGEISRDHENSEVPVAQDEERLYD